jgi:hypothetical protein
MPADVLMDSNPLLPLSFRQKEAPLCLLLSRSVRVVFGRRQRFRALDAPVSQRQRSAGIYNVGRGTSDHL